MAAEVLILHQSLSYQKYKETFLEDAFVVVAAHFRYLQLMNFDLFQANRVAFLDHHIKPVELKIHRILFFENI